MTILTQARKKFLAPERPVGASLYRTSACEFAFKRDYIRPSRRSPRTLGSAKLTLTTLVSSQWLMWFAYWISDWKLAGALTGALILSLDGSNAAWPQTNAPP